MPCPTNVHKKLKNFKKRRERTQFDRPLLQAGPRCQAASEMQDFFRIINSHASVNGPVTVHSSSSTPCKQLYLEAEIGAQLHE